MEKFFEGGGKMECIYCYGHVRVVDSWGNYKTVECNSCGVRFSVRKEDERKKEGEKGGCSCQ